MPRYRRAVEYDPNTFPTLAVECALGRQCACNGVCVCLCGCGACLPSFADALPHITEALRHQGMPCSNRPHLLPCLSFALFSPPSPTMLFFGTVFPSPPCQGALFKWGYTSTPTCTPARAAILTGQKPWNHGSLGAVSVANVYPFEMYVGSCRVVPCCVAHNAMLNTAKVANPRRAPMA